MPLELIAHVAQLTLSMAGIVQPVYLDLFIVFKERNNSAFFKPQHWKFGSFLNWHLLCLYELQALSRGLQIAKTASSFIVCDIPLQKMLQALPQIRAWSYVTIIHRGYYPEIALT